MFFMKDRTTTENYTYGNTLSLHDALPIKPGKRLGQLGFTSARRGAFILDSAWRALQIPDARPRLTAGHSGSHKCEFHGAQFIDAAIFCLRVFIGCDLVSGEQSARKADRKSTRLNSSH